MLNVVKNGDKTIKVTMSYIPGISEKLDSMGAKKVQNIPQVWILPESEYEVFQDFCKKYFEEVDHEENH